MRCPFCHTHETKVTDSRLVGEGYQVRRRRECLSCEARYTTYENVELSMPRIIKRDASRQPFSEDKLRQGLLKALEKRPVAMDAVEQLIGRIYRRLREQGEREVSSQMLGEWIMEELRNLDDVAYVRFASVYRRFEDIDAFHKEIENLRLMDKDAE